MTKSLGARFLVVLMLLVAVVHAQQADETMSEANDKYLMDLLEKKPTRQILYEWCICDASQVCIQEAEEDIRKLDLANLVSNVTLFRNYTLNLNVSGTECVDKILKYKVKALVSSTPLPTFNPPTDATTAGTTPPSTEPTSKTTEQDILTPTRTTSQAVTEKPGPTVPESTVVSPTEEPKVPVTAGTLTPIPVSTTNSSSTGGTSKPTPGSVDPESGSSSLYWVIPVVIVVLVAMLIGGFYIHRYAKKAGFRQSSKAESTKISVSNSCNEGV